MLDPIPRTVSVGKDHTGDPKLDRLQEDLRRTADALNALIAFVAACPLLPGRLISVTLAAATFKTVRHGLGVPASCLVVRMNSNASGSGPVFAERVPQTGAGLDLNNELSIISDVACTMDLWFYPRASLAIDSSNNQSPVL